MKEQIFVEEKVKEIIYEGRKYRVEFNEFSPLGATVYEIRPGGVEILRDPLGLDSYLKNGKVYYKNNAILYGEAKQNRLALLKAVIKAAQ